MKRLVLRMGSLTGAASAALGSAAASICCIGPLAITLLGVQGAIVAAGIKPYRWYLLAGSFVLIGLAFWSVYRPSPRKVTAGASCSIGAGGGRVSRLVLWTASGIWVAAVALNIAIDQQWL